jgi:serine/threonine-protein kinase
MLETAEAGQLPGGRLLRAGTKVGEFVVEETIGVGGTSRVYRARHPLIGKRAAVKILDQGLLSSARARKRFLREAQAVNRIEHPNVIDVFAYGHLDDGRAYLVMEHLRGEPLDAVMARGLARTDGVDILLQTLDALEAAHQADLVHRDLKPANIFVARVGEDNLLVKLLDFGIAKEIGTQRRMTETTGKIFLGTPQYTAPEQLDGKEVDARADIYAFGVLAYELLTGSRPWRDRPGVKAVVALGPPVAPRGLGKDLSLLLLRCLATAPSARPTLAECRAALRGARTGPRVRWPERFLWAALGAAATGVAYYAVSAVR